MVLRSIGVLSAGKVMGITYALLGLIPGVIIALAAMAGVAGNANQGDHSALPFLGMGAFAVVFIPLLYGIGGFIGGIICAAVYNLVAGVVGGLELEFERRGTMVGVNQ
jgi:hypothetical protein